LSNFIRQIYKILFGCHLVNERISVHAKTA
jgi:hypothetical protein